MPHPNLDSFRQDVIDGFRSAPPGRPASRYADYMLLPEAQRSGDELDAVDHEFSARVLEWLGYSVPPCNVQHNRNRVGGIPDHVAEVNGLPVLVWEDKNTTESLTAVHEAQLQRYAEGRTRYAVWTNARRLVAFRVEPAGTMTRLVDVDIHGVCGAQASLETVRDEVETQLAYFKLLVSAQRFTEFESLADDLAVDEQTFLAQASPLTGAQALEAFLGGARGALEGLRLAALAAFKEAVESALGNRSAQTEIVRQWEDAAERYFEGLGALQSTDVGRRIEDIRLQLGNFRDADLNEILGGLPMQAPVRNTTREFATHTQRANGSLLSKRLGSYSSERILDAYQVWREQQSEEENATAEIYAQQVAYVFFVRLFLARILEDKGIITPRLASDGGFQRWRELVASQDIHGQTYLQLVNRRVGLFYQHFFRQPVFDWFVPDDYLLLLTLNFLARWRLDDIDSDVLGFTYENYLDRVIRNKKGHFLTRPEVVELILDLMDYRGPEIIGRRLVDPACGSGSFLVHAARRYRQALAETAPVAGGEGGEVGLARQFIDDVTRLIAGMDIEPFAAYLAELNLLIQLLDDVRILMQAGEPPSLDRFQVYRTDSLDLPDYLLAGMALPQQVNVDAELDEAYALKARQADFQAGFSYVVANPPYINPKQHQPAARYRAEPFFSQHLPGDTNTYLMFLRLGMYLLAEGGRLAMIVPLTLIGDQSAAGIRQLLCLPPRAPTKVVRFYTGNVLFRGVDQATCIVVVDTARERITVGGGMTVEEVRASETAVRSRLVIDATPPTAAWGRSFLVSPDRQPYAVWRQVRGRCGGRLAELLRQSVNCRQGDFNATHVNPCRVGAPTPNALPVYKGENVGRYRLLPATPSDWAVARPAGSLQGPQEAASRTVAELASLSTMEEGVVLRETARLNTRRRLIGTWFERGSQRSMGFSHELWRMTARPGRRNEALSTLGLVNSALVAYLYNLFSTNNHVVMGDLERVPMPDVQSLDAAQLAALVEIALQEHAQFQTGHVEVVDAVPGDDGVVSVDAGLVLQRSGLPQLRMGDLIRRGDIVARQDARIGVLISGGRLTFREGIEAEPYLELLAHAARHSLGEVMETLHVPDVSVAPVFGQRLNEAQWEAQRQWNRCEQAESAIDDWVFDWYRIWSSWRSRISDGLPWAR